MERSALKSTTDGRGPLTSGVPLRYSPWSRATEPLMFLLTDLAVLGGAVLVPLVGSFSQLRYSATDERLFLHPGIATVYVLLSIGLLGLTGGYSPAVCHSLARQAGRIVGVVSFVAMTVAASVTFMSPVQDHYAEIALTWGSAVAFLITSRALVIWLLKTLRSRGIGRKRVIIAGSPESASYVAEQLQQNSHTYEVVGRVYFSNGGNGSSESKRSTDEDVEALSRLVESNSPCEVVIAAPASLYTAVERAIRSEISSGPPVHLAIHPLLDGFQPRGFENLGGVLSTVRLGAGRFSPHYETIKRLLDVVMSLALLAFVAPIMAVVAVAIKLDSPGPIIFRQTRAGRWGRPFTMYKFRSMRQDAEEDLDELLSENEASGVIFKLGDDPRITRVGKIIRRLSVDELPQIFNVLIGTMSLVGPRPPLPRELEEYGPRDLHRLEAVPGVTGLWQVSRGAENSFEEMVDLDLEYIARWSLATDLMILLKTVPAAFRSRSAY